MGLHKKTTCRDVFCYRIIVVVFLAHRQYTNNFYMGPVWQLFYFKLETLPRSGAHPCPCYSC